MNNRAHRQREPGRSAPYAAGRPFSAGLLVKADPLQCPATTSVIGIPLQEPPDSRFWAEVVHRSTSPSQRIQELLLRDHLQPAPPGHQLVRLLLLAAHAVRAYAVVLLAHHQVVRCRRSRCCPRCRPVRHQLLGLAAGHGQHGAGEYHAPAVEGAVRIVFAGSPTMGLYGVPRMAPLGL